MRLGAHMPTAGGIHTALVRGRQAGCQAVQLFVKNNMQWYGRPFKPEEIQRYQAELALGGIEVVFGHAGYLINLAAPEGEKRRHSIQSLIQELELAEAVGLPFLVMHPGSHLGEGESVGLDRLVAGLDEVFAATSQLKVRVALENTAGQGSCLGADLSHLAAAFDGVKNPARLGICLDTAHLFAAGHDLRQPGEWDRIMDQVRKLFGVRQLLAMHLNDSKTALGSRVDRHEHIGKGKLGLEAFRPIITDSRLKRLPACIEIPKSKDLHEDVHNLGLLRSLAT